MGGESTVGKPNIDSEHEQGERGGEARHLVRGQSEQLPRPHPDPGLHDALWLCPLLL